MLVGWTGSTFVFYRYFNEGNRQDMGWICLLRAEKSQTGKRDMNLLKNQT